MELNAFLQQLGISGDEQQVKDFLTCNEQQIKDFFLERWKEYEQNNNSEELVESKETEMPIKFESSETEKNENMQDPLYFQIINKHITLPNGKVNQEYSVGFDIGEIIPEIEEVEFEGLNEIGLVFDSETKQIRGIPLTSGDHKIKIKCKRKDWEEGKPVFERDIVLIINPDPRSLWNDIPTPEDIEYYKADSDKKFVLVESKTTKGFLGIGRKEETRKDMVAASQRGRSHAHEGKARDDDFSLFFDEKTEWYVIAVADGAGSAKFSRKGSEIACQTVVDICEKQLSVRNENFEKSIQVFNQEQSQENRNEVGKILYDIVGNAAFKAYKNIEEESQKKGNPIKDYSTTLLLAICKKFDFGWFVGSFWVGDGGIGIYNDATQYLKIMGEPDGGEFAGQTRFLTMSEVIQPAEIYKRLRFDIVSDFTALCLMSDGITDPKFETDANLSKIEKWNDLWQDLSENVDFADDNEQSAEQLLKWLDFWSPGNHDDRTIAILF